MEIRLSPPLREKHGAEVEKFQGKLDNRIAPARGALTLGKGKADDRSERCLVKAIPLSIVSKIQLRSRTSSGDHHTINLNRFFLQLRRTNERSY